MKIFLPLMALLALTACATLEPYINTTATVSEQALSVELAAAQVAITNGKPLSAKAIELLTRQHSALLSARPFVDLSYGGNPPANLVAARQQVDDLFALVIK